MRKIKLIILGSIFALFLGTNTIATITAFAAPTELLIEPKADIIEWRYKVENGKMFRRQYNYSKQKWIGKWEYVSDVVE